jgi:recombinational DNA repair protein (RecF pathway)
MREFVTDAAVLSLEETGEVSMRIFFFTELFGAVAAQARSARKLTSKLAGHLQIGMVSTVRLVEKNGLRVVDALAWDALSASPKDLFILGYLANHHGRDEALWELLTRGEFRWRAALPLLGWDPARAECASCARMRPDVFSVRHHAFLCHSCALRVRSPFGAVSIREGVLKGHPRMR